jgi:hypothetical protein
VAGPTPCATAGCPVPVVQPEGLGGKRRYCTECRPERVRPGTPRAAAAAAELAEQSTLRVRTERELRQLGAADSLDGVLLIQMADRMDRTRDASPYAALSKTYRQTLDLIRERAAVTAPAPADPITDMARKRAERQAAAGG